MRNEPTAPYLEITASPVAAINCGQLAIDVPVQNEPNEPTVREEKKRPHPGFFLLLAIMGLLGCSAGMKVHHDYLALGDSYTIGESVDAQDRWPVKLARALREKGVELGEPEIVATTGWTTDELSTGMDAAKPHGPYRLVTLLIGVNNQYRGRSVEEFRDQFRGLMQRAIELAGKHASRVVVVSIPDWGMTPFAKGQDAAKIGREIDAFNGVCREEAEKAGARFVDITPISREVEKDGSLAAEDGLHPSGKMYARWVEVIGPAALDAVKESKTEER